ncbi:MAG: hypothetical protein LBB75_06870 [Oscillospiraceae bacterium]|jgi:DNA-directed RNA polymerase specialized sigma24 family protein|nr:hypothetical protein [Oscillospiraceae bacterium]
MDEFEEIYARCFSGVYRYALRLTRGEHLAEELTAETFFKALKNLPRYDETKSDIRVWLCQIAKNTWISQCRKQGRALILFHPLCRPTPATRPTRHLPLAVRFAHWGRPLAVSASYMNALHILAETAKGRPQ